VSVATSPPRSARGPGRACRREARGELRPKHTPGCVRPGVRVSPPPPRGGRRGDDNSSRTSCAEPGGDGRPGQTQCRTTLIPRRARRRARADRVGCRGRGGLSVELQPRHPAAGRDRPGSVRLRANGSLSLDFAGEPHAGQALEGQPWTRKATVAIEDRFYNHGGVDYEASHAPPGRTSAPVRSCRVARRSRSSSCATSTSPRSELKRKLKEACLAIKLSRRWSRTDPQRVHEPGLLRQPRLRDRGGRATYFSKHARNPSLDQSACSPACRRRRRYTTHCTGPPPRSPVATPCCARCTTTGTSPPSSTARRGRIASSGSGPESSTRH
jgi:hypothetical protein